MLTGHPRRALVLLSHARQRLALRDDRMAGARTMRTHRTGVRARGSQRPGVPADSADQARGAEGVQGGPGLAD